ncbi:DUF1294 domain-containing protein [Microvirga guangxiensis]|uniref:Uncharacterized membrane protein YsdA, DUF1294 family n=1 Tax=Microvirga guangxiensis TaxID=549386 RepID=A0A1G5I011_9HYPH|nr:DUF1294 domain-containing protein [Microvirga guangxiensis]SCY69284.1 Uncharacterized membrane protein YsdA, DUF1294 family [Microvirga guangxiensis]
MLLHFALYILFINAATYVAYAVDKRRAQAGEYRISEGTLLGFALVGGTFGAFAARWILRHKTRKEPFRTQLLLITLLQIILCLILIFPATRAELVRFLLH